MDVHSIITDLSKWLGSDAARVVVPAALTVVGLIVGVLATRRKNSREDRAQAVSALRKTRRFKAPRAYSDLDDDLVELTDALHLFPLLSGHRDLLGEVTWALWRDSHADWAETDGEGPMAGAYSAELGKVRDQIAAALSARIRASAIHRRWKLQREVRRLTAAANSILPQEATLGSRPTKNTICVDPTRLYDQRARLKREIEQLDRESSPGQDD
ncbi:MAG: hypothetical protein ACR2JK_08355 [Geodermatophilaceae bacterium]